MKLFQSPEDFMLLKKYGLSTLGMGSTGTVQLVCHKASKNGPYAMKKMHLPNPEEATYVRKEIELHSRLKHPNVIQLIDYFFQDDHAFVFMEYGSEGDLFKYLRRTLSVPLSEILRIFTEVVLGVEYLHSMNIIHRDIKPENIILTSTLSAKICDFGWSIECGEFESRRTICGTPEYMSPELLINGSQNKRSDIYALGVLLFEMLHKRPPYSGRRVEDVKRKIEIGKIVFKRGLDPNLKDLLLKMLETDPNKRINFQGIKQHSGMTDFFSKKLNENDFLNRDNIENKKKTNVSNNRNLKDPKSQFNNLESSTKNYKNPISNLNPEINLQDLDFRKKNKTQKSNLENRLRNKNEKQKISSIYEKQNQTNLIQAERINTKKQNLYDKKKAKKSCNYPTKPQNPERRGSLNSGLAGRVIAKESTLKKLYNQRQLKPKNEISIYNKNHKKQKLRKEKDTQETKNNLRPNTHRKVAVSVIVGNKTKTSEYIEKFMSNGKNNSHYKTLPNQQRDFKNQNSAKISSQCEINFENKNIKNQGRDKFLRNKNKEIKKLDTFWERYEQFKQEKGNNKEKSRFPAISLYKTTDNWIRKANPKKSNINNHRKNLNSKNSKIDKVRNIFENKTRGLSMDTKLNPILESSFSKKTPVKESQQNKNDNRKKIIKQKKFFTESKKEAIQKNSNHTKNNKRTKNLEKFRKERWKKGVWMEAGVGVDRHKKKREIQWKAVENLYKNKDQGRKHKKKKQQTDVIKKNYPKIENSAPLFREEYLKSGIYSGESSDWKNSESNKIENYTSISHAKQYLDFESQNKKRKKKKNLYHPISKSGLPLKKSTVRKEKSRSLLKKRKKKRNQDFKEPHQKNNLQSSKMMRGEKTEETKKRESTALFEDYEPFQGETVGKIDFTKYGFRKRNKVNQVSKKAKDQKLKNPTSPYYKENIAKSPKKKDKTSKISEHTSATRAKKNKDFEHRRNYNISIDLGNPQGLANRVRVISVEYKKPPKTEKKKDKQENNIYHPKTHNKQKKFVNQILNKNSIKQIDYQRSPSRFNRGGSTRKFRALSKDNIISKRKISREPSTDKIYMNHLQQLLNASKNPKQTKNSNQIYSYKDSPNLQSELNHKKIGNWRNSASPTNAYQKLRIERVVTEPNGSEIANQVNWRNQMIEEPDRKYHWLNQQRSAHRTHQKKEHNKKVFTKKVGKIHEYSEITTTPENSDRNSKKREVLSGLPSPGKLGATTQLGLINTLQRTSKDPTVGLSWQNNRILTEDTLPFESPKNLNHLPVNSVNSGELRRREKEASNFLPNRKQKQFKTFLRKGKNPSLSEQVHENKMMKYKRGPIVLLNKEMRKSSPLKQVGKVLTLKMSTSHTRLGVKTQEVPQTSTTETIRPKSSLFKDNKLLRHSRITSSGYIQITKMTPKRNNTRDSSSEVKPENFQTFGRIDIIKSYFKTEDMSQRKLPNQSNKHDLKKMITDKPKKTLREKLLIARSQSSQILKTNFRINLKKQNFNSKDSKVKDFSNKKEKKRDAKKDKKAEKNRRNDEKIRKKGEIKKFLKIDIKSERKRPATILKGKTLMEEYTERMKRGSSPSISLNTYYKLPKGTKLKKKTPKK